MNTRFIYTSVFFLLLASRLALGQGAGGAGLGAVAPFVNGDTVAVARVDLKKLDLTGSIKTIVALVPQQARQVAELGETLAKGEAIKQALLDNGVSELFAVCHSLDFRNPSNSFFFVAPVAAGKKPQQVIDAITKIAGPSPGELGIVGNAILVGPPQTMDRLKAIHSAPRPDLAKALAATKSTTVQLAATLPADIRRVLGESLDRLPKELGGGSGKELADGLQWLAVGIDAPPKLAITLTLQAKDGKAAEQARTTLKSAVEMLLQNEHAVGSFPPLTEVGPLLVPEVKGDRLVLTLNEANGKAQKFMDALIKPALANAQAAASIQISMNNLKQLMLAMHNYHDTYLHFPAAYGKKKDGTKLLSWRVYLLPFLDQDKLYKEFRLDEPWDSEHNKKLIEKMPPVFASPALPAELAKKGMTTYVVPVGDKTVFAGADGTNISQITDGTSNTIAILETDAAHAVIWTKPDDLVIDWKAPLKGLTGIWKSGNNSRFLTGFCDGSVRAISDKIDPLIMKKLLQMNDGEPIGDIP